MKSMEQHEKFMRLAIEKTKEGIKNNQAPFGACIVKDGKIIALTHNTVWRDTDPTHHAEINAIHDACQILGTIDLTGASIYSTTEPCPMCFSAIHWAKIKTIYFGASIQDAKTAGFSEMDASNEKLADLCQLDIEIHARLLEKEATLLFNDWKENGGKEY